MVSKNDVSVEARQRILDAAQSEFSEKGYDGARVDSIALRAQVNKALIYYYFKSKEVLLNELLEQFRIDRMHLRDVLEKNTMRENLPSEIGKADVDFLFSRREILRVALMEELKSTAQSGAFLNHWAENLEPARKVYRENGFSFRYTPRVIAALYFYQLMPVVSFAIMGETLAKCLNLDIKILKMEFMKLVQETLVRHSESVFSASNKDPSVEVVLPKTGHSGVDAEKKVPDHLQASQADIQKIQAKYLVNGKMTKFPLKEKAIVVMLEYFSTLFDSRKMYSEKEVNAILGKVADDYVKVRRYMIEYGYLGRRSDGSAYWSRG